MKQKSLFIYLTIAFIFTLHPCTSQHIKPYSPPTQESFLGLGIGINDYGIGIGTEVNIADNVWIYGMGGLSTWGYRLTGGMTFYPGQNGYHSAFSVGYSYASGINDFVTGALEFEENYWQAKEQDVLLDLFPIRTINLAYSYHAKVGRKSKFVFSAGYAITLTDEIYKEKTPNTYRELTQESKDIIDVMAPGGIIVGVKYMIGL